jgi:hypothetical protein
MSRKAAIQAYKEQKPVRGIFAVRLEPEGRVWVDSAMDLRAAENRTRSSLRFGDRFLDKQLVEEFQALGEHAYAFEILEKLDEDLAPMSVRDVLKERKRFWLEKLKGIPISPV